MKSCFRWRNTLLSLFCVASFTVLAGSQPGDYNIDTYTYCSGATCTSVTTVYMMDATGKWVVVSQTSQTFANPNYYVKER